MCKICMFKKLENGWKSDFWQKKTFSYFFVFDENSKNKVNQNFVPYDCGYTHSIQSIGALYKTFLIFWEKNGKISMVQDSRKRQLCRTQLALTCANW